MSEPEQTHRCSRNFGRPWDVTRRHSLKSSPFSCFWRVSRGRNSRSSRVCSKTIITYERRKKSEGKREEDLSGLPVERVEHPIPGEERVCPACGGPMHAMGHDVCRELEIVPAQVKVVEHVQEVYACRACEKNEISVPVRKAPMPEPVIKGSVASPSSVAHIMVQKYVNAVPLYRQDMGFLADGLLLSRQTMANWMIYSSA